ncbi:hypothetical protein DFA_00409 [Cavenderia fasciculata]|uniref:Carbohydrate binding domain-containing protein n=1 Tax=Cavenderia fasciculata TaxID=261658 RepID=F4PRP9_CACFS|nr:uncharacterized protein DFA_00409 [Cavenderia fasciculata]EGG20548.1 hypothetical protein DFA_00409 [Cavenderia fasciculata]|eukprot:XP_004358398.1 hypothetical protein DFA_00409 [Cavenderia fasciculata]
MFKNNNSLLLLILTISVILTTFSVKADRPKELARNYDQVWPAVPPGGGGPYAYLEIYIHDTVIFRPTSSEAIVIYSTQTPSGTNPIAGNASANSPFYFTFNIGGEYIFSSNSTHVPFKLFVVSQ